jgi:hypothetical protein
MQENNEIKNVPNNSISNNSEITLYCKLCKKHKEKLEFHTHTRMINSEIIEIIHIKNL